MRLKPRHYVLFVVIVAIFVFNIVRNHRPKLTLAPVPAHVTTAPPADTPTWRSFDKAAGLRDAADAEFQPALHDLQQLIDAAPSDPTTADVKGCITWLDFYRQGALHPAIDPKWKQRSQRHLEGCTHYHLDTTYDPA